ncbi:tetratricopeptide repeat protein [Maribacter sp. PR1]|uniref:Tetratricopeptide repeat protein n=1 Tax=Maribacter cobaltidurans TaxID=1178778 RepID=A0ABU7IR18_9FLAO|nr:MULTISPECIES: tetratricopeptide repeat protein [Maribacter]MDC6388022.1 tetratricopeptide repeat protein [Maribacter sp. PR1]MEE1975410.1 tetratricopeptide repeat protein [Maribacter cobaltidurans]
MRKLITTFLLLFISTFIVAQEEDVKEKAKALKNSTNLTWDGNKNLSENNFVQAEVDYRKAIAESPENAAAPYNLGTAYYNQETYSEAFGRFKEAGEATSSKEEKHKAYHNMGNVFMKRKEYPKAIEAYKEALRNDPTDDETRYNLALAKEMQKKEEEENKDKNDENKDQQDQQDKKDQDQDKEGDNKDDQNQDKKDQGDQGDQGDEKKDENKEGDGDQKEEQKKKPEQGDQPQDQPQRKPNQLSKQQVENLLRAMQNAEKQVQEKIDAKKVKGAKVKNEKDW